MTSVLPPTGCAEVRKFFGFLLYASDKYGKIPVAKAMDVYQMQLHGRTVRKHINAMWTDEMITEMLELKDSGMTYKEIALKIGRKHSQVKNALYRYTSASFRRKREGF